MRIEHGFVVARRPPAAGRDLWLDFPSVGATENLLMAAVLAEGTTVIDNVAREPEIIDLCEMLVAMGARIDGIVHLDADRPRRRPASPGRARDGPGPHRRRHLGVRRRDRRRRPDRARRLAGTSTSSSTSWRAPARRSSELEDGFRVVVDRRLEAFDVVTLPYPGFPTDLQPFAMALAAVSDGTAMITENVFEARFMFAQELARLGADLRTDGHHAVVRGRAALSGRRWSPTTSGPARRWCSPGWPPRAPRRSPSPSTSTAATPTSWRCCAGWAPTSAGSAYPTRGLTRRVRNSRLP